MAQLEIDKLNFHRGSFGLQIDSLQVAPGEKIAILGENGSGKTTLLQLLAGLLKSKKGKIGYGDRPLKKIPVAERARLFSLLPQFSEVVFPFTVSEVVLFGRYPLLRGSAFSEQDRKATEERLAELDLLPLRERSFNQLSGGEQRRVMLARVLNQQAPLIYLDEPNAGLDIRHTLEIFSRLTERSETVIASVHDVNLAGQFFHRFWLLKQGRLLADLSREQLTPEHLAETYDVEVVTGPVAFQFQR